MTVLEIESSRSEGTPEEQAEKVYQRKLKRRNPVRRHRSQTAISHRGQAMPLVYIVAGSTPKRAIKAPVTKLGAYIASTCHWMPSAASVTE
jgi:hypothetical protein